MVSAYYFLIFLVDTLLSVFGKSATMLLPALLSAIASCLYASSDCCGKGWETFSRAITICIGFIIAGCGIWHALISPITLILHTVILTQGICGLLVTVASPVINHLAKEEK